MVDPKIGEHRGRIPQNAAKMRGFSLSASGFTAETDWLLEEGGFEPSVPLPKSPRRGLFVEGGPDGLAR